MKIDSGNIAFRIMNVLAFIACPAAAQALVYLADSNLEVYIG
jgi:hypothetical protein